MNMSRRLRESESRIQVTAIQQVYKLAELGYGDEIRLLRFGPFGEDTFRGRTCNLVSFNPDDAEGNEEDLMEFTGEAGNGEDIFVFDQEIGQSGCNWLDSFAFEEEINEGNIVVDGRVPDDVLVKAGLLGDGLKDKVYSFSFDFVITDDSSLEDGDDARYELLKKIKNISWIKVVGTPNEDATEWTKKEYGLSESSVSRRKRNWG